VLGGSLIGPISNYVSAETIFLKSAWRFIGSCFFVFPYAIIKSYFFNKQKSEEELSKYKPRSAKCYFEGFLLIIVITAALFGWTAIAVWASLNTI
jgi:hypothetical protein